MTKTGRQLQQGRPLGHVARASVLWGYLRTAVMGLVGIPATIVLARLLSPADFGIAAVATFFGLLAARLASGGLGSALVRVKDLREDHISSVFVVNAGLGALGTLALILAAPYIGAFYGSPEVASVLPLVALNFAVASLSMVQQALLSRDLRYREMATIGSLDTLVAAISAVAFASLGFRYWSLVLGDVCGGIAKWLYGVRLVGWHLRLRFVPAAARELGSFALGSYVRRLLEHFTRHADSIVIGRVLGMTSLGFYEKAFSLGYKVFARMTVVGPSVSFRIFAIIQDEPARFRRAYRKVIMAITLLGYLAFGALVTVAPHLIVVAFGEKWRPSIVPFQILSAAFALKLLNQYANAAAQAKGWVWPQVWRQVVQVVCVVAGVYAASPWGINAAASAVFGATVVMFLLTQSMMRSATGLGWADILQPQVPAVVGAAALMTVLWSVDAVLLPGRPDALVLIVQAGAGALFTLAFAWWCPFREARSLMYDMVGDFSPRVARAIWKDISDEERERKARQRAGVGRSAATPDGIVALEAAAPQEAVGSRPN